jgi:hypothetical protein
MTMMMVLYLEKQTTCHLLSRQQTVLLQRWQASSRKRQEALHQQNPRVRPDERSLLPLHALDHSNLHPKKAKKRKKKHRRPNLRDLNPNNFNPLSARQLNPNTFLPARQMHQASSHLQTSMTKRKDLLADTISTTFTKV